MIEWIDSLNDYAAPSRDDAADYAALVEDLIRLMHIRADCQWAIGDALQDVETVYEECTLERIAAQIGASAQSLYAWRDLAGYYTPAMRADYKARGLMFSHLREAFKFPTHAEIHEFLWQCQLNRWSTTQAAIEVRKARGQPVTPAPVYHGPATFAMDRGRMVVTGLEGIVLEQGVRYEILIRRAL